MSGENQLNQEKAPASGSDTVLRGMMLLALMLILVVGGYAIVFRRPPLPPAAAAIDPNVFVALIVQPMAGYPGTLSWGTLYALADELPSRPGWQTRYQAARALAHLGSDAVPWDDYREMLDEHRQFRNFRTRLADGRVVIEEAAARQIVLGGLKDLAAWHSRHVKIAPGEQLLAVYSAVDELAKSPIAELKTQAQTTGATFFR